MRGYFIQPNKACQTIRHGIWVDVETDQYQSGPYEQTHMLRTGFAAYSRRLPIGKWSNPDWLKFTSADEFWSWVYDHTKPRTTTYMFCHNSNFDYPVLETFYTLPHDGWKPTMVVLEAPPTIIKLKNGTRRLILLDTLNWWRAPLKALGESIGLPKLDMPAKDAPEKDWDAYNKRDVEIIMYMVQQWADWLKSNDLGGFECTLAGQALRTYRHRFMKHKILIDNHKAALECSRSCYHGGRTEAFRIGSFTGEFYLYDVNSMYPYVMRNRYYPTRLRWYTCYTDVKDLKAMLRQYLICARVNITIDKPAIGIRHHEKLCYPIGTFNAQLCTPELQWVLANGRINHVFDMSLYRRADIFSAFIDFFYKRRLEYKQDGNRVAEQNVKILLNSLYGKFGQNGRVYTPVCETSDLDPKAWKEIDIDTRTVTNYRSVMGVIYELQKAPESANSHPAIAAHVTAYARMYLFYLMEMAGADNVLYCDTDSLLVTEIGADRLDDISHENWLGKLKLECVYDNVTIHGAKDYVFGDKRKVKGVKKNAIWYDDNTVEQQKWAGLAGMMRDGNLSLPTTTTILKTLRRDYDKGIVTDSGRVLPFSLSEPAVYPVGSGTVATAS